MLVIYTNFNQNFHSNATEHKLGRKKKCPAYKLGFHCLNNYIYNLKELLWYLIITLNIHAENPSPWQKANKISVNLTYS